MFEKRAFLLDLTHRAPNRPLLQEFVDILARYRYNELFAYAAKPECAMPVGTADSTVPPFDDESPSAQVDVRRLAACCAMQGVALTPLTPEGYEELLLAGETVCVPTGSARSLVGRVEEMREQMERAEATGRLRNLRRFLVTDFSDGVAWQPLAVSLPGLVMGGNFAASGPKAAKMDLERELDSVLGAPVGGLLLKLGTLYLRGGAVRNGESEFFNILAREIGYSRHPGITEFVLEEVSGIAQGVRIAAERWTDFNDWAKEIVYAANLLDAACHRRDEARLRALRDEHGRIWRLRNVAGGRVASLAKLPRF